jgi:hypothetical protein
VKEDGQAEQEGDGKYIFPSQFRLHTHIEGRNKEEQGRHVDLYIGAIEPDAEGKSYYAGGEKSFYPFHAYAKQKDLVDHCKCETSPNGVGYFHQVVVGNMREQETEKTKDAVGCDMIQQMVWRKEIAPLYKPQQVGHGIMWTGKIGSEIENEEDKKEKKDIDGIGNLR